MRRLLMVLVASLVVLSACQGTVSDTSSTETTGSTAPASTSGDADAEPDQDGDGGDEADDRRGGTLRVLLQADGEHLDPSATTNSTTLILIQLLYDRLVEVMPDDQIVPGLATGWEISDDGLTYTFQLREGVTFHDGSEFTSDDVKATIERIQNPDTASPVRANFEIVRSVETPESHVVVINLTAPYSPFLAQLASQNSSIVSSDGSDDLRTAPNGTGSFMLESWDINQEVALVRNPNYWDSGKPYLDGVTFTFLEDANARIAALQSERVDFVYRMPEELVPILRAEEGITVYGGAGTNSWYYWLLNPHNGPTADVLVRQALAYAVDRDQLVDLCRPGAAWPHSSGFLPADHWAGVPEQIYSHDPVRARELLTEAGYPDGFDISVWVLTGRASYSCMAEALQQQLAEVGVNMTIELRPIAEMVAAGEHIDGDFESMMLGLVGTLDPDIRVQQTFVSGGGSNLMQFSDPEVDELAAAAQVATTREERAELYRQLQERLAEVGPYVYLHHYGSFDAVLDTVQGYEWNHGLIYWTLKNVWIES